MLTIRLTRTAIALAALLLAASLVRFSASPWPATLADDSAGYLLEALALAPYSEPNPVFVEAAKSEQLPVLFSWLLALTATANDLEHAHVLVALVQALGVIAFWSWARRRITSQEAFALLLAGLFVAMPGFWVGTLGILSEGTFALILLALLCWFPGTPRDSSLPEQTAVGLLVLAAILTRTAGIALLLAWPLWLLLNRAPPRQLLAPLATAAVFVVYQSFLDSSVGWYADQGIAPIFERTFLGVDNGSVDLWTVIMTNFAELSRGWREILLGAPLATHPVFAALGLALALPALAGTAVRLAKFEFDALFATLYLCMLLAWPYPGQQFRFLLPLVPILVGHAGYFLLSMGGNGQPALARKLLVSILAGLVLVNLFSIQARRFQLDESERELGAVTEYYRVAERGSATRYAATFLGIMKSMKRAGQTLPGGSRVVTAKEDFFTLLSGLPSRRLLGPGDHERQLCDMRLDGTTHVFVSDLTTSWTREGLAAAERFAPVASDRIEWALDHGAQVIILSVDRTRLGEEIEHRGLICGPMIDQATANSEETMP